MSLSSGLRCVAVPRFDKHIIAVFTPAKLRGKVWGGKIKVLKNITKSMCYIVFWRRR